MPIKDHHVVYQLPSAKVATYLGVQMEVQPLPYQPVLFLIDED